MVVENHSIKISFLGTMSDSSHTIKLLDSQKNPSDNFDLIYRNFTNIMNRLMNKMDRWMGWMDLINLWTMFNKFAHYQLFLNYDYISLYLLTLIHSKEMNYNIYTTLIVFILYLFILNSVQSIVVPPECKSCVGPGTPCGMTYLDSNRLYSNYFKQQQQQLLLLRSATDLDIASHFLKLITGTRTRAQINDLKTLLYLFSSPAGVLLTGTLSTFTSLSLGKRQKIMSSLKCSANPLRRQAFKAIAPLTFSLYVTVLGKESGINANWDALKYQLPPPAEHLPTEENLSFIQINSERSLKADVVVIGSGAGGGITAAMLAEAGYSVIVLEKGGYVSPNAMTWKESEAFPMLYEQAGTMTSDDLSISVLAGSCVGGGTTVNWAASIQTPDSVVEEWRQSCPNTFGESYKTALNTVCARLNVNIDESVHNSANRILSDGLDELGYQNTVIPRNVKHCDTTQCGYCSMGCRSKSKQSSMVTYLEDACSKGAQIITNCFAEHITITNAPGGGRAVHGVVGSVMHQDGVRFRVFIKANIVVSSAGAIHTPALLLRSGINNPNIGKTLGLEESDSRCRGCSTNTGGCRCSKDWYSSGRCTAGRQQRHRRIPKDVFSAHQMGSCKMGSSKQNSVVKETGESWDLQRLFVSDGSVLPTAVEEEEIVIATESAAEDLNSNSNNYNNSKSNNIKMDTASAGTPPPSKLVSFIAGGIAGVTAKSAVAPLERVKILYQTRSAQYSLDSVVSSLNKITQNEGWKGLWRGNTATITRVFPYAAVQFFSYETIKKSLKSFAPHYARNHDGSLTTSYKLFAGGLAGGFAQTVSYPFDVVRRRMQTHGYGDGKVEINLKHSSFTNIYRIFRSEGLLSLYKGLSINYIKVIPTSAIAFYTYELSTNVLNQMISKN
ncbi:glucose-methanol-choline oxidoreductase [Heterostelium album PN500]|uniref:Glucose-methanol-choline oxidoreductase n=1 Tax=Heterostelium pallidum (strain ATCC 26659 / Pp 5 / PN500) TaxID=670386 RepID=D3AXM0_HETP5|nr:glucose-methanol-choline oxidoreductase [Heterostelium album PN500]EFA85697.1 glucose-methanol-choline oxidoreductase [Heterostelium album PN500]|eukprot:XP_020437803.1 glucose-methanol-choline oxidoreductase [Heterostelium album PN500]